MRTIPPGRPLALAAEACRLLGRPAAAVASAPGRVNLLGEHTDYNGGLCLPQALPHATYAAATPRGDGVNRLVSTAAGPWEGTRADLRRATGWAAYAAGVLWALAEEGIEVPDLDVAVASSVPLGAGLSSSAALTCAVALAALGAVGAELPLDRVRRACMRAESEVAGVPTGGMDQTVALHARAGSALLLDFTSGHRRPVPWHPRSAGLDLLVVASGVRHALAEGGYAARRAECERAADALGVDSLSQATTGGVERLPDPVLRRRARHVVAENRRVREAVAALEADDWPAFGAAMTASHCSLRDDFEVSCPELDTIVSTALRAGALGARITGGGFGGSAVVLVPGGEVRSVATAVDRGLAALGAGPATYLSTGAGGTAAGVRRGG